MINEETLEYGLLQHIKMCLECNNESQAIRLIEKYGFQKQEERYSEEDMKEAIRFGFDKGFCSNSSNKVKNNLSSEKEWFKQFKNK